MARQSSRMQVVGLGPAGILASYRATDQGIKVTGWDPAGPNLKGTLCCFRSQLPEWFPSRAIAHTCRIAVRFENKTIPLDDEYAVISPRLPEVLGGYDIVQLPAATEATNVLWCVSRPTPEDRLANGQRVARQFAVGVFVPETAIPASQRQAMLMDWTPLGNDQELPASFSYRIPLGDGRWLIEETVVATTLAREKIVPYLSGQLTARMDRLGISFGVEAANWEREVVDFPLGTAKVSNTKNRFSAHDGWMHAATGYAFGALAADVDRVLAAFSAQQNLRTKSQQLNWQLRRFGQAALLTFSPSQTRDFFQEFFELGPDAVRKYLISDSASATAAVMFRLGLRLVWKHPALAWKCVLAARNF